MAKERTPRFPGLVAIGSQLIQHKDINWRNPENGYLDNDFNYFDGRDPVSNHLPRDEISHDL